MNNYSLKTVSYIGKTKPVPLECTGMFFIPEHSSNIPLLSFFDIFAIAHERHGLQQSIHRTTFQNIPVALECHKNNFAQQNRGLQRCPSPNIPDIPDGLPLPLPQLFFEPTVQNFHLVIPKHFIKTCASE